MVVVAIITFLTGIFLFQQKRFDSSTLLRSLAYSVALSVRQAQGVRHERQAVRHGCRQL